MTIQKYDWEIIRIHYVQGRENGHGLEWPTLEQLALEYSIPPSTVRSRAHRDGWVQERAEFHTELVHRTQEKTLEQLAEKASQLDLQAFSVARAMLALAGSELAQGTKEGRLRLPEQERLLRMCDLAHKLGRRALGIGDTSE